MGHPGFQISDIQLYAKLKIVNDGLLLGILLAIGQTERYAVKTVIMNLMVPITCWERADVLALWYIMFSCVVVTFPYGVLGPLFFFIVLIPIFCILPYFDMTQCLCLLQTDKYVIRVCVCTFLW